MSNFVSDLKLGQYYEEKYIEMRKFDDYEHPKNLAFKDYDFKNNKTGKTYEVKADRKTIKTGNLFIETECKGEYSGLNATKANCWIHFVCCENPLDAEYYYKIKPVELVKIVKESGRKVQYVGDGGRVVGYLLSEWYLKNYKHIIQKKVSTELI